MCSLWRRNSPENTNLLRNGAVLLEKLITFCDGKRNPIRNFSVEEIKAATNNFDQRRVTVYEYHKLYKGFLQNHPVLIMHCYSNGRSQWVRDFCYSKWEEDVCYNNIVFPIQMSHKNILMLIGCCLETETPILVFEAAQKGTLADRIYRDDGSFEPLRLAHRFKVAMEIANAVAYLHLGFRKPIVFKDIKPSKVLFDEQNVAKLFDFTLSETIPEGETHIKNSDGITRGTIGFTAPEYLMTSDCNEKCDVYSFGVLLLELLTGKSVLNFNRAVANNVWHWLDYTKQCAENDTLNEIVDPIINEDSSCDGKEEKLLAFYLLILECTNESPEARPTMMHVAKQLRQLYLSVT